MTDSELEGICAQALNMVRTQRQNDPNGFNFFLGVYHPEFGLKRLDKLEKEIIELAGEGFLNYDSKKSQVFFILRRIIEFDPSLFPAMIFATASNKFTTTAKFLELPAEERQKLLDAGHDRHHKAVAEGYLSLADCLSCVGQTAERVCIASVNIGADGPYGPKQVMFVDQSKFRGTMKLYGKEEV